MAVAEAAIAEASAAAEAVVTEVVSAAVTVAEGVGEEEVSAADEVASEVVVGVTGGRPAGGADAVEPTSHPRENPKLR